MSDWMLHFITIQHMEPEFNSFFFLILGHMVRSETCDVRCFEKSDIVDSSGVCVHFAIQMERIVFWSRITHLPVGAG